jgi:DNA (cytosine-5)-methyltransferase 1
MKVVSLFSGVGGLDLGFIQVGHEIVWANDNDPDAVKTYKRNIGTHIICKDISEVNANEIPAHDILIGGFPCQGFSVANMNRTKTDARNKLYLEFLRVLEVKKPKYFVAENVKGILNLAKGEVFQMILNDFKRTGYQVKYKVLNAMDFGVPQSRKRVILFGIRNDISCEIKFPEPTHGESDLLRNLKPWVSIGEALKNIPEPEDNPEISNHTYSKFKLKFNGYLGNRKIDPNKPAPTVTARGDNKGGVVVLHHPNNHRRMSARELAITQSFPIDFIFEGNRSSVYRQIGNAVPPLMSRAIAEVF